MSLNTFLLDGLAEILARDLLEAEPGHCLRVDYLAKEEAQSLCRLLRNSLRKGEACAFVLSTEASDDDLMISPERAIELRNRKQTRLFLAIPTGTVHAAASSLSNSFASFDLEAALKELVQKAMGHLSEELRQAARSVITELKGSLTRSLEEKADYLAYLVGNPTLEAAGVELWRVGLIPDAGGDFVNRLDRNAHCVRELVRPARSHTDPIERMEGLGLEKGAVRNELMVFLKDKRLRDSKSWLPLLAAPPYLGRLTFERWAFIESERSDLVSLEVQPFLDPQGQVLGYTSLSQPDGLGTQPYASVGPKAKVTVKWDSIPKSPTNLKRWMAEMIPSREEYSPEEATGVELPQTRVSAKARSAKVSLDIDLDSLAVRAAQVRVVALDESNEPLRGADGNVIEGLSGEFWLVEKTVIDDLPSKGKKRTDPNLPFARVRIALEVKGESLQESPGQWTERDWAYYAITFNERHTSRIGLSPYLKALEARCFGELEGLGAYELSIDALEDFAPPGKETSAGIAAMLGDDLLGAFPAKRKAFFRLLQAQEGRGYVETVDWGTELSQAVRGYARAYREMLERLRTPEEIVAALRIDTLRVTVEQPQGLENAVVLLPTHPLRALWFASYSELLRSWEPSLLAQEPKSRKSLVDLELLKGVAPVNCPAFVPGFDDDIYIFNHNLSFFWAVCLPRTAKDPGRQIAELSRLLRAPQDDTCFSSVFPDRVTNQFLIYRQVHPYLETLRISVLNPGSGDFLADVFRGLYQDAQEHENDTAAPPPHLDIILHAEPPLPTRLRPLEELQKEVYDNLTRGTATHLNPLFSFALRPISEAVNLPGGDVNLSVAMDLTEPCLTGTSASCTGDSASFYGLLARLQTCFENAEGVSRWLHTLNFPPQSSRERHPVQAAFTTDLVDTHGTYQHAISRLLGGLSGALQPALSIELRPEERIRLDAVHRTSDWVISLDRFFGVEFYDDPRDADLARVARKYLLDYAPEFIEGLGHRMLVTTAHREEIEEILSRAMGDLGFAAVEDSVGEVLELLKTISGRLALRTLGNETQAKEAVSLGLVASHLRSSGELDNSILIPVDAHPELFGPHRERRGRGSNLARCDLIQVRFQRNRMVARFIEVKFRSAAGSSDELFERIADQIHETEAVFNDLFFRRDPVRLDHVLQRSRLMNILRFYLRRAWRHGLVKTEEGLRSIEESIDRLETGIPDLRAEHLGFIVNAAGPPTRAIQHRDVEIRFLTAKDLVHIVLAERDEKPQTRKGKTDVESEPPDEPKPPSQGSTEADAPAHLPEEIAAHGHPSSPDTGSDEAPPHVPPGEVAVALGVPPGETGPVLWRAGVRGSPHLFILGIPGQGKSWTITRLLIEMQRQSLPALVFDFHGQFSDKEGPYYRTASPSILDASQGLDFSPFEADAGTGTGPGAWQPNCFVVAEIFEYVCGLGDMQRDVVYEALRDCYQDLGFEEGKPTRLPSVSEVRRRLEELEEERKVRNVLARCRPLLELGLFNEDLTESRVDLLERFAKNGMVLDVSKLGLETLQMAAGAFLLRKIYKDMFRWGETGQLRFAIVLDEAHRLARDITLPKIMKEGRKFGLAVIVASQGLTDFHPDVVGNAGTKVVFRTNYPMSRKVSGFLKARKSFDLTSAVEQLPVGFAFVQTPEMGTCARVRMYPLATS